MQILFFRSAQGQNDRLSGELQAVLSETKKGSRQFFEITTAGILRFAQKDSVQGVSRILHPPPPLGRGLCIPVSGLQTPWRDAPASADEPGVDWLRINRGQNPGPEGSYLVIRLGRFPDGAPGASTRRPYCTMKLIRSSNSVALRRVP